MTYSSEENLAEEYKSKTQSTTSGDSNKVLRALQLAYKKKKSKN